jgi:hypothetical protein
MTKKNRYEYFRIRTDIGKLEAMAKGYSESRGHDVFLVRDDRFATSLGCNKCEHWACAEIDEGVSVVHGDIVEYDCGDIISVSSGDIDMDIVWAIYGGE